MFRITYTLGTGCIATATVTVNAYPRPVGNTASGVTIGNILLYPNPTTGGFTVEASAAGELYVNTIDGKELAKYPINQGITSMELPRGLAAGVYMCRYSGNDGTTAIVRLVYEP